MFVKRRARKKKALTDAVQIIPFPNQSIRNEKATIATNSQAVKQNFSARINEKPEPKIASTPLGNLNSDLISINEMLNLSKQKGNASVHNFNKEQNSFTLDQIKILWRQFAFKMKENGIETLYVALTKRDPVIVNETQIVQEFDNFIQVEMMQNHIADMLAFVREGVKNFYIKIEFQVTENLSNDKKFQTGKDKFISLAKKNPNLYSFQKMFNLDIDY